MNFEALIFSGLIVIKSVQQKRWSTEFPSLFSPLELEREEKLDLQKLDDTLRRIIERARGSVVKSGLYQSTNRPVHQKYFYFSLFFNSLQTPFSVGISICPRRAFRNGEKLKTYKHGGQRRGALSACGLVDLWSAWRPPVRNVTDSNCVLQTYCQYRLQLLLYEFPVSVQTTSRPPHW